METRVKWNLDEATEISVLSGWDIIRFKKGANNWMYGITGKPDVRSITHSKLPALLEKYESAGCGVLIATPKKEEPLKLGTKMVEVSTKEFDWKDVAYVKITKGNGRVLEFRYRDTDHKGDYVFELSVIPPGEVAILSHANWYTWEIEADIKSASNVHVEILNHDGEMMQYEK